MRDAFSESHPAVNFIFYIGALVMGMCFIHPVFLICSLILSMTYYWVLKRGILRYVAQMSVIFILLSVLNPLFNTYGDTVLFTYLNHRPYTLEALVYGMANGAMFVTILTWFATYNQVMTSDKFLYCFGKLAPSLSLILTMVLRLVPSFQKKIQQIAAARRCIGMSMETGTVSEKAEHGMILVSALTSWALEGGVVMTDSMRSRGFGCAKRTTFSLYRMKRRDKELLLLMLIMMTVIVFCAIRGGMKVVYIPQINIRGLDNVWTILGSTCYFLFLLIPTGIQIREEIAWQISKSKI